MRALLVVALGCAAVRVAGFGTGQLHPPRATVQSRRKEPGRSSTSPSSPSPFSPLGNFISWENGISGRSLTGPARFLRLEAFGPGGGPGGRGEPQFNLAPLLGLALFLLFPGLLFNLFNIAFALVVLGPVVLAVGLNIYIKLNTLEKPCPVCGATVQAQKDSLTQCYNCGSILQADGEKIFASRGSGGLGDTGGFGSLFESLFRDDFFSSGSGYSSPSMPPPSSAGGGRGSRQQVYRDDMEQGKIIDVEVIPDDDDGD